MDRYIRQTFQLYRKVYTGHPRQIWVLAGLTFANRMGMMVLPFLTVYLTTQLHFSLKEAGVLASTFGVGSILGSWLGGQGTDRFGGRPVIVGSLLVSGGMLIALQWVHSFSGFMGTIFLTAVTGEAYRPAMGALVGEYVPGEKAGRAMSLIRLAMGLGLSAGPAIGGWIAASFGYSWLFWIDGGTCILAAVFFGLASRNWSAQTTISKSEASSLPPKSPPPSRNRSYIWFLTVTTIVGFVFAQWFHTVPVFLKSIWQLSEDRIGLLLGVSSFMIVLVEMPLVYIFEQKGRVLRSVLWGTAMFALSFLPFLLPGSFGWAFVAVVVWTLGIMLFLSFNNSIPIKFAPADRRGDYMAWYWMAWSVVRTATPLLGFFLIDEIGYAAFWWVLFGTASSGLLLSWVLGKRIVAA